MLNLTGSVSYLLMLERIAFEQKEASEVYMSLEDRKNAITGGKPAVAAPKKLQIGSDYYALSFVSFMKHFKEKHSITPAQKSMFFVNVCFIFAIQSCLIGLAYYDMMVSMKTFGNFLIMMHTDISMTRILLAFLMHM